MKYYFTTYKMNRYHGCNNITTFTIKRNVTTLCWDLDISYQHAACFGLGLALGMLFGLPPELLLPRLSTPTRLHCHCSSTRHFHLTCSCDKKLVYFLGGKV